MKQLLVAALLGLAIAGCRAGTNASTSNQSMSPEQVTDKIASLRKLIIPPEGASRADVDSVFGDPKETKEPKGKGSAAMYPMHSYPLLPLKQGQEYGASLCVTYRNDKVHFAGINHLCIDKNMDKEPEPEELSRENTLVLADLMEIEKKFETRLKDAPWNK